ncbi:hypothetical protein J437_LFUL009257 [Ladona fulva]|uniref:Peptidase S1 domain-containing protein n=1 Tax=Ladona fulva TaxID=123851 RepID=A0A8K0P7Z8_LADFU|nr:hypothetical protein J437_LFUL009257 [Ladona fulva]
MFVDYPGTQLIEISRRKLIRPFEDLDNVFHPYIIGGEVVKGREFPGQISLLLEGSHHCGGSIINENYILTAAHCDPDVFKSHFTLDAKSSNLIALSGTNSLSTGGTRHKVVAIYLHEDYSPQDSWHNDIAVMRDGLVSEDLLKVDLQTINLEVCKEIYEKDGFKVFPEEICANTPEGQKGPCGGDSGGPLLVNDQVVGLVSWSQDCALKEWPTVFTRVSSYIDWINSKISS